MKNIKIKNPVVGPMPSPAIRSTQPLCFPSCPSVRGDRKHIVAVQKSGLVDLDVEFAEKMSKPADRRHHDQRLDQGNV